ncbi:Sensor protein ZraS [bioreactor metagenome]|uniref:Sensor protein ZraS n=1 Tax=bioreactor metagenome TaxID=1076179 RepID=A0A645FTR2_9ZZZZ
MDELGEIPEVDCVPAQINQVFMNLLVNAAQAIQEHGRITVRSGVAGERVWFEVEDTGRGMSDAVRQRIFEPFFTTKPVGKGTGLGLSISYDIIVKKHRGYIDVDSEPGKGSRFRIWLPIKAAAPA